MTKAGKQTPRTPLLVVDDEADIRDVLKIALHDMGYRVLTAGDGREALTVFQKEHPPMVLTDIKMPNMDGIELLQRIKQADPETEVIMITGHGDMNLAVKSLKNDATDFIAKPINIDALDIALKRAAEKRLTRRKLKEYTQNLETLVQEKTALQDNLSHLGLMISSISHGIKGLLTGLDGGMYLLDAGLDKNDPQKLAEAGRILKMMVGRIRRMVSDILFYAKERDLKLETIRVADFAEDVAQVVAPKIENQHIAFVRECGCTTETMTIDAGFVHSALINILENAIDACRKDESESEHRIRFSVRADEDHILFDIRDNGVGMDMETRENLFSLFYSAKGREGTGLGLFISDRIIKQHGGVITVDSVKGRGSRFLVKIPQSPVEKK